MVNWIKKKLFLYRLTSCPHEVTAWKDKNVTKFSHPCFL